MQDPGEDHEQVDHARRASAPDRHIMVKSENHRDQRRWKAKFAEHEKQPVVAEAEKGSLGVEQDQRRDITNVGWMRRPRFLEHVRAVATLHGEDAAGGVQVNDVVNDLTAFDESSLDGR